jgi:hypothetical protein
MMCRHGPQLFLQTVEDLLWLLLRTPRPEQNFRRLFVHWLNDTVIRMPRRLYRKPGAKPWLGDFPIAIRLGLVSHLAAIIGGTAIRQQLLVSPQSCSAFERALDMLPPTDVEEFTRRLASWPQTLRTLVFQAQSTQ